MNFTKLQVALILVCCGLIINITAILFLYASGQTRMQKDQIAIPIVLSPTLSPSPIIEKKLIIKASIPYWDQKNGFATILEYPNAVDQINMFWYFLTSEGEIQKYTDAIEDKTILDYAHQQKMQVAAVITNLPEYSGSTWDSERVESVLSDEKKREKHIQDIHNLVTRVGFDGVIIDYEEVSRSMRNKFSIFIEELSKKLDQDNKYVSVVLHAKTSVSDERNGNGAFQDWKELSKHADQLQLMAYGQHWDEGEAGPIASLSWVEEIIAYTEILALPKKKLFLGIPLYGYDWNQGSDDAATGLTFLDIQKILSKTNSKITWDEKSKSPFFAYEEVSDQHEVWFENADSVHEKIKLAEKAGLVGVTFWRLGGEDSTIWDIVSSY